MLECMLAELPEVVVLGEVGHLWERGLLGNELCACTEPFHSCPFWCEVGAVAFNGWQNVDARRVLALRYAVDRQRRLGSTMRRHPPSKTSAALTEYTDYYARLYDAARTITGASVVVDSSKVAPTVMALSHSDSIDLRVLHIVRDSRAVAFSWQKLVTRPEKMGAEMPRPSPLVSTEWWLVHNGSLATLKRRNVPMVRLRYEDLVTAPSAVTASAWNTLGLPGRGELPMADDDTIILGGTHSVAGNPMRFRTGPTTLKPDTAWIEGLTRRDRTLVTAMSWPLLKAYGYPLRLSA